MASLASAACLGKNFLTPNSKHLTHPAHKIMVPIVKTVKFSAENQVFLHFLPKILLLLHLLLMLFSVIKHDI